MDKENTTPPPALRSHSHPQQSQSVRSELMELLKDPSASFTKSVGAMKNLKIARAPVKQRNEKHSKVLPFNAEVMSEYIDLNNCTWANFHPSSALGQALQKNTQLFTKSRFSLDSRHHTCDNYDDDRSYCGSDSESDSEDEKERPLITAKIPIGVHETVYEGKRIVLLHQEIGEPRSKGHRDPASEKSMILFAEGVDNLATITEFGEKIIKEMASPPKPQNFRLYRWKHDCQCWSLISNEKARPMNSVILPVGFRESVEMDMDRFLSKKTKAWYDKRGIPYKRCYMFWGVPGTGKTSLITALAGRFRRNVCFLSAHHPKFTDEMLKDALQRIPSRAIVVLEDIDSLFDKDRKTNNSMNPLTFTGLLNAVDGIGEHRGTIFVMTTNFIDRLDSALIRAGRVDMKVEFKHADTHQLSELFKWFYDETPEVAEKLAPAWVEACQKQFPDGVTMAELQQHFVDNMHSDAETCVANLKLYDLPLMQKQVKAADEKRKREAEKAREEAIKNGEIPDDQADSPSRGAPRGGFGRGFPIRGRGRGRGRGRPDRRNRGHW